MGPGTTTHPVRRTWTVEIRPEAHGQHLVCQHCDTTPIGAGASEVWATAARHHLAYHARAEPLAPHLRTCQCGEHACRWHPRHRGCDGPLVLLLARDYSGRLWRLADTCHACATVIPHSAVVPEPHHTPAISGPGSSRLLPGGGMSRENVEYHLWGVDELHILF